MNTKENKVEWKSLLKKSSGNTDDSTSPVLFTAADITIQVQAFTADENIFDWVLEPCGVFRIALLLLGVYALGLSAYALFNVTKVFDFYQQSNKSLHNKMALALRVCILVPEC